MKRLTRLLMAYSVLFSIAGFVVSVYAWGQADDRYFTWMVSGGSSMLAVGLTTFVNAVIIELSY